VVKRDGVHGAEAGQVVLVRHVVAVPGDDVVGGEILSRTEKLPVEFVEDRVVCLPLFEPGDRRLEVTGTRQSICTWTKANSPHHTGMSDCYGGVGGTE
jgi:hypothetical protein